MKSAKYLEFCDTFHHDLEKTKENRWKMKEVEGKIVFCGSYPHRRDSLVMRLEGCDKDIIWDESTNISLPALVGQTLRGFYEKYDALKIEIDAYELLDGDKVLRRGAISNRYKFIEEEKNAT